MRSVCLALVLASSASAADLASIPANKWVEIKYRTVQPAEKGSYVSAGWNKLVFDAAGKRVLFYDRWHDRTHGGTTIYGNCLFAFDPAAGSLTPLRIDNWTKIDTKTGGYRTKPLPANEEEPTPCPRHVYHAFELVPGRGVYLCNGANQSVIDAKGGYVGHDACDGAWRLDLKVNRWSRVGEGKAPPNRLDDAMAYSPEIDALVYAGANGQIWILDLKKNGWRKAKASPPENTAMGRTIWHDAPRRRMLLVGGGQLDAWTKGKAPHHREVYAFDPVKETVKRLADAPTALYSAHLSHDLKRDLFFTVAVFSKKEQPSGMWAYDPKKDEWREIKPDGGLPEHSGWMGWMQTCHDPASGCLIGKKRDRWYAYRPAEK